MLERTHGHTACLVDAQMNLQSTMKLLGVLLFAGTAGLTGSAVDNRPVKTRANVDRDRPDFAKLPLSFVPNIGQTDQRVRYSAQAGGASFYFTKREAVLSFAKKLETKKRDTKGPRVEGLILRLGFLHANPQPAVDGRAPLSGRIHYLIGNDRAKWHTGVPTFGEIVYRNLWPEIDLAFQGGNGQLEYQFVVRPGARVGDIRLAYRGASGIALDRAGNLLIKSSFGSLTDTRPVSYQLIGDKQVPVVSHFLLAGQRVGFAVDPAGYAYVAGTTLSADFPITPGAYQTTYAGGFGDAFVTKLNRDGSGLVYSTFLGSPGDDGAYYGDAIAIDPTGNAYVTGF